MSTEKTKAPPQIKSKIQDASLFELSLDDIIEMKNHKHTKTSRNTSELHSTHSTHSNSKPHKKHSSSKKHIHKPKPEPEYEDSSSSSSYDTSESDSSSDDEEFNERRKVKQSHKSKQTLSAKRHIIELKVPSKSPKKILEELGIKKSDKYKFHLFAEHV